MADPFGDMFADNGKKKPARDDDCLDLDFLNAGTVKPAGLVLPAPASLLLFPPCELTAADPVRLSWWIDFRSIFCDPREAFQEGCCV